VLPGQLIERLGGVPEREEHLLRLNPGASQQRGASLQGQVDETLEIGWTRGGDGTVDAGEGSVRSGRRDGPTGDVGVAHLAGRELREAAAHGEHVVGALVVGDAAEDEGRRHGSILPPVAPSGHAAEPSSGRGFGPIFVGMTRARTGALGLEAARPQRVLHDKHVGERRRRPRPVHAVPIVRLT